MVNLISIVAQNEVIKKFGHIALYRAPLILTRFLGLYATKLFVETFDMVGYHTLNTIEGEWGRKPPFNHMLHEQTVP